MAAPSACNQQPWEFVVIDAPDLIQEIPRFNPAATPLRSAPLAIVVCGNLRRQVPLAEGFWVQDCSAAIQNLLLAAHACGLGAVWLGGYPLQHLVDRVQELVGLPEHIIPLAVLAVGYPSETKEAEDRYKPSRIHHNRWRGSTLDKE
jgi:nitroreductase